jgi:hypothetical protein
MIFGFFFINNHMTEFFFFFTAVLILVWGQAVAYWWCFLALNLFLKLQFDYSLNNWGLAGMHLLAWGVPLTSIIVTSAVADPETSYGGGLSLFCSYRYPFEWIFIQGPSQFLWVITLLAAPFIFYYIVKSRKYVRKNLA